MKSLYDLSDGDILRDLIAVAVIGKFHGIRMYITFEFT